MPRGEVGASSRKGVCVRNTDFEANIDEAPNEAERYLVYADWLLEKCDPRGELIVVQHRLATAHDEREISRLESDQRLLFDRFKKELIGPNAKYASLAYSGDRFRTFSWRYGFIRSARLSPLAFTKTATADVLRELLTHPSGRFLERLLLGRPDPRTLAVLREHAPKTLCSLVIGDCTTEAVQLDEICRELPFLRHLKVLNRVLFNGPFEASALEELQMVVASQNSARAVLEMRAPRLRSIRLAVNAEVDVVSLVAKLDVMTTLEELHLAHAYAWQGSLESEAVQRHLAAISERGVKRCERLEMDVGLPEIEVDP